MCDCWNIPTSEILILIFFYFYHILLNTNSDYNFKQRINHMHSAFKSKDKNVFNRYILFDYLFLKKNCSYDVGVCTNPTSWGEGL